jgi:hypothetical protein
LKPDPSVCSGAAQTLKATRIAPLAVHARKGDRLARSSREALVSRESRVVDHRAPERLTLADPECARSDTNSNGFVALRAFAHFGVPPDQRRDDLRRVADLR